MSPGRNEMQAVDLQAAALLRELLEHAGSQNDLKPDDLLLFLYRLRDGYSIVRSMRGHSTGTSFENLPDILYQLESRPDAALQSEEWRSRIESLLRELAEGRLTLEQKGDGKNPSQ